MMYLDDHMSGWGWVFMGVGSVLFWAALIVGIVVLVRHLNGSPLGRNNWPSAEDLLAQRFARGEIDETEYRQRLAVLADRGRNLNTSPSERR
jgi:putative membrane protein